MRAGRSASPGRSKTVAGSPRRRATTVVEVYSDNDISASTRSRKRRPDYERMLDDAETGRFEVLLAYSTSRLTRRQREIGDMLDVHESHGTQLVTVASGRPDCPLPTGG